MKASSNVKPQSKFEIENHEDVAVIIFYPGYPEIPYELTESGERSYNYDMYRLVVPHRDLLSGSVADNYNAWLEMAIAKEEVPAPVESDTDKITRLETEQARMQEIVDTMLGGV